MCWGYFCFSLDGSLSDWFSHDWLIHRSRAVLETPKGASNDGEESDKDDREEEGFLMHRN